MVFRDGPKRPAEGDPFPSWRLLQRISGPWTLSFDLGAAPASPVRLHLDGWIFPSDARLNLAIAQRSDLPPARLRAATAARPRPATTARTAATSIGNGSPPGRTWSRPCAVTT